MTFIYRLSVGLSVVGWALLTGLPHANGHTLSLSDNNSSISQLTQRPSNLGHPRKGTRRGGASRGGSCDLPPDASPLTALMPADPEATPDSLAPETVLSLTYQDAPDLWFYLPYPLDNNSDIDFVVKTADDDTLYEARLIYSEINENEINENEINENEINENEINVSMNDLMPGIIHVSFANLGVTLVPETAYHWYLTVHCNTGGSVSVDGWLQQQEISPVEMLTPATAAEAIETLATYEVSQGFWVDALSRLQNGLTAAPNSERLQTTWQSLLSAEGLADIAEQPIRDCCEFELVP